MTITRYYRASDESSGIAALEQAGLSGVDAETGRRWYSQRTPIVDVVGQIMLTPPVLDDEGNETTPAVFAEGWHWNIYGGEAVESLAEFEIDAPTNPRRKLAGT